MIKEFIAHSAKGGRRSFAGGRVAIVRNVAFGVARG